MIGNQKTDIKMKVFQKGQVVIPVDLRRKYNIEIGDHIHIITTADGILLKPTIKKGVKDTLTDRLFGIFRRQAKKKSEITENDINRATEKAFSDGWPK